MKKRNNGTDFKIIEEIPITAGTIRQKKRPPCNHLDIGAWRWPTLARNHAGDWLMLS